MIQWDWHFVGRHHQARKSSVLTTMTTYSGVEAHGFAAFDALAPPITALLHWKGEFRQLSDHSLRMTRPSAKAAATNMKTAPVSGNGYRRVNGYRTESGAFGPAVRYRSRPRQLGATLNSELHAGARWCGVRQALAGCTTCWLAWHAARPTGSPSPSSSLASSPSTSRSRPLGA
jgi:hypothetical protein